MSRSIRCNVVRDLIGKTCSYLGRLDLVSSFDLASSSRVSDLLIGYRRGHTSLVSTRDISLVDSSLEMSRGEGESVMYKNGQSIRINPQYSIRCPVHARISSRRVLKNAPSALSKQKKASRARSPGTGRGRGDARGNRGSGDSWQLAREFRLYGEQQAMESDCRYFHTFGCNGSTLQISDISMRQVMIQDVSPGQRSLLREEYFDRCF